MHLYCWRINHLYQKYIKKKYFHCRPFHFKSKGIYVICVYWFKEYILPFYGIVIITVICSVWRHCCKYYFYCVCYFTSLNDSLFLQFKNVTVFIEHWWFKIITYPNKNKLNTSFVFVSCNFFLTNCWSTPVPNPSLV